MLDALGGVMAANNDIQDDIVRLVAEHGNVNEVQPPRQEQQNHQPPNQPPLEDHAQDDDWDNELPSELLDHPVVVAFQESKANFLVSDPRIAGNPIIYASEVGWKFEGKV